MQNMSRYSRDIPPFVVCMLSRQVADDGTIKPSRGGNRARERGQCFCVCRDDLQTIQGMDNGGMQELQRGSKSQKGIILSLVFRDKTMLYCLAFTKSQKIVISGAYRVCLREPES